MTEQVMEQAARAVRGNGMSSIKEVVSGWSDVARLLRGCHDGALVPVVIPKDKRGMAWTSLIWFGLWALLSGFFLFIGDHGALGGLSIFVAAQGEAKAQQQLATAYRDDIATEAARALREQMSQGEEYAHLRSRHSGVVSGAPR